MLSSQELGRCRRSKYLARAPSENEEDSETEPEEDTFSRPESAQVIKLSAVLRGCRGCYPWRGRHRGGGTDVFLQGVWVHKKFIAYVRMARTPANAPCLLTLVLASCFRRYFLGSVKAAGGRFCHIPTGNARQQGREAQVAS